LSKNHHQILKAQCSEDFFLFYSVGFNSSGFDGEGLLFSALIPGGMKLGGAILLPFQTWPHQHSPC